MRMRKLSELLCASALVLLAFPPGATAQTTALPAPWFGPSGGTYTYNLTVAINDANRDVPPPTIYYTTDRSTPSPSNGKQYLGAIPVTANVTIKAMAVYPSSRYANSPVSTASYVLNLPYEAPLPRGQWAWENGGTSGPGCEFNSGALGTYGTLGVPAAANIPGSRIPAAHWIDKNGNLWLFGGFAPTPGVGNMCSWVNDLWMFNVSTKQWAWMSGSSTYPINPIAFPSGCQAGVYGTRGQFAAGNVPGSRRSSVGWMDQSGNLWLFGGEGCDSTGELGPLNDVWEFNVSTRQWAWMAGTNLAWQGGAYGYIHQASAGNTPGGRLSAVGVTDRNGNFWLFGGFGFGYSPFNESDLNDLWEFNPNTRLWAWMGGSHITGHPGVYGTHQVPSPTNVPGARDRASAWVDAGGNFWLFGGIGVGAGSTTGLLNDLWEFNPSDLNWTWAAGNAYAGTYPATVLANGQAGTYDNLGVPDPGNNPGSRIQATTWTDAQGNLWLLGGQGDDSAGNEGLLNDLWEFDRSKWLWAWMGGSKVVPPQGMTVYGTYRVPSAQTLPGARSGSVGWTDKSGNLWLFGGFAGGPFNALLNDLFEYQMP
jgi:N-acetylneuraminic acid mutarotase